MQEEPDNQPDEAERAVPAASAAVNSVRNSASETLAHVTSEKAYYTKEHVRQDLRIMAKAYGLESPDQLTYELISTHKTQITIAGEAMSTFLYVMRFNNAYEMTDFRDAFEQLMRIADFSSVEPGFEPVSEPVPEPIPEPEAIYTPAPVTKPARARGSGSRRGGGTSPIPLQQPERVLGELEAMAPQIQRLYEVVDLRLVDLRNCGSLEVELPDGRRIRPLAWLATLTAKMGYSETDNPTDEQMERTLYDLKRRFKKR